MNKTCAHRKQIIHRGKISCYICGEVIGYNDVSAWQEFSYLKNINKYQKYDTLIFGLLTATNPFDYPNIMDIYDLQFHQPISWKDIYDITYMFIGAHEYLTIPSRFNKIPVWDYKCWWMLNKFRDFFPSLNRLYAMKRAMQYFNLDHTWMPCKLAKTQLNKHNRKWRQFIIYNHTKYNIEINDIISSPLDCIDLYWKQYDITKQVILKYENNINYTQKYSWWVWDVPTTVAIKLNKKNIKRIIRSIVNYEVVRIWVKTKHVFRSYDLKYADLIYKHKGGIMDRVQYK